MVDWGPASAPALNALEKHLLLQGVLQVSDVALLRQRMAADSAEAKRGDASATGSLGTEPRSGVIMHEARRINRDFSTLLNPALSCLLRLGATAPVPAEAALGEMAKKIAQWVFQAIQISASQSQLTPAAEAAPGGSDLPQARWDTQGACQGGITLLTQYFYPADTSARLDILTALMKNLLNPAFSRVVLFCELQNGDASEGAGATLRKEQDAGPYVITPVDDASLRRRVRADLLAHAHAHATSAPITASNVDEAMRRVVLLPVSERLHFSTAIDFANTYIMRHDDKGENSAEGKGGSTCVVIANSDIYFDETLESLQRAWPLDHRNASSPTVLALSKWSVLGPEHAADREQLALSLRSDSQDAWIFRAPLVPLGSRPSSGGESHSNSSSGSSGSKRDSANPIVLQTHFPLGAPRCDNRLAEVFHAYGFIPLNAALLVHAIEACAPAPASRGRARARASGGGSGTGKGGIYGQAGSVRGAGALVFVSDLAA